MAKGIHEHEHTRRLGEGIITAIAVGGTLIILGVIFALNPDIFGQISRFFQDLTSRNLPGNPSFSLPAPANPAQHTGFFTALLQFTIGIAILQVIILPIRIIFHSRIGKIAETVGNLVFWAGAAFLVNTFLLAGTLRAWFEFWGAIIILIGVSLVARAIVYFARR